MFDKDCFRVFYLGEFERNESDKCFKKIIEGGNLWKIMLCYSEIIYYGKCYKFLLIVFKILY